MCELIVVCSKCERIKTSIKLKIRRTNKAIEKIGDRDPHLCSKLKGEIVGLEWSLKKIKQKEEECSVMNNIKV